MIIRYLSHSCFEIKSMKTILIDPYFKGNPLAPKYIGKPDIVLVTHEHFDHGVDAQEFDSLVVSPPAPPNVIYKKQIQMKIGDKQTVNGIEIEMISASHHQSKYPTGFIVTIEGKRIAHLGDTYLDGVRPLSNIDLLLLPIGGYYTMNIDEAIEALRRIKPKLAIPMHYDTFDQIKANPEDFKTKAEKEGFKVKILQFGEEFEFK